MASDLTGMVRRILKLAAAAFAFFLYVWFAAVRHAPSVKRRKAARRAARAREQVSKEGAAGTGP